MTLEKLGQMVAKGFVENDKRFDAIDKKLDRLEFLIAGQYAKRIDKLEEDIGKLKEVLQFK